MHLIEFSYRLDNILSSLQSEPHPTQKQQPQFLLQSTSLNLIKTPVYSTLNKQHNIQTLAITHKQYFQQYLQSKVLLYRHYFLRTQQSSHRLLMLRYSTELNSRLKSIHLNVHPISGEYIVNFRAFIPERTFSNCNQQIEILESALRLLQKCIDQQLSKILFYAGSNLEYQWFNQKICQQDHLQQFKTFAASSNHYAWKILKGRTENSKKQTKKGRYNALKQQFINTPIGQMHIGETYSLFKAFQNPITNIQEFKHLTMTEDQSLKNAYLPKPCVRKDFKLINSITVDKQSWQFFKKSPQGKISTRQFGYINLQIHNKQPAAVIYEKQILNKLPPDQFMGLPKYYYITNLGRETESFVLTNLNKSKLYQQYLKSNRATMSLLTQLNLLHQIVLALKYLRDNGLVFHNLTPYTVYMKKGFKLKLYGMHNSFHQEIFLCKSNFISDDYQPLKSQFPYVNISKFGRNRSYDDQRSDVFSMGALIYETLHNKPHIYIKSSDLIRQNHQVDSFKNQYLSLISLQKLSKPISLMSKLMTYIALQSTILENCYQNSSQTQSSSIKQKSVDLRPYLDWMVIMVRHSLDYYQHIL